MTGQRTNARSPTTGKPRAARLSVDRVLEAAFARVRSTGLPSLTMRQLADDLGTGPMTLYRHVSGRDDLLRRMLDRTVAEMDLPPVSLDPREELTGLVTAVHARFRRDPWVVTLVASEGLSSPDILPVVERMLNALKNAGCNHDEMAAAYALIWHYTYGEAIDSHRDGELDRVAAGMGDIDVGEYPTLAEMLCRRRGTQRRHLFEGNLQRLLDSVL
ncbi:transcriptional regulator, TetR family [Quadrisphaera granulorum]|uniref:TetR family transcriptional regulator n=1 Tax=Quadrisphaera granulorum TaxID=317664 RepID=A0A316AAV8_9ACTN|nr:TetR/AcrR family transcriptional regulator [Quadrisphaera granulorum]PWJ54348.1 TetR family transcriptional regulator [Quadrisphaera granulorum]SZE96120.1 transcriptional regulator, TetR family [Quadrisphaera granulorum]